MKRLLSACFLTFSILSYSVSAQFNKQRCYFPDGTLQDNANYQPCNNAAGTHSMCCAISGNGADTCLSNGLCSTSLTDGRALWRETCTDPTWESPACVKICMTKGKYHDWLSKDAPLTLCPDGTICCGGEVTGGKCCAASEGVQILTGAAQLTPIVTTSMRPPSSSSTSEATTTSTSSSSSTITTSATSSSQESDPASAASDTSSPSPSPQNTTSSSSSGISPVTIAVAVAVPILLILISVIAYLLWRRNKRKGPGVYEKNSKGPVEIGTSNTTYPAGYYNPAKSTRTERRLSPLELSAVPEPHMVRHHIHIHELQ